MSASSNKRSLSRKRKKYFSAINLQILREHLPQRRKDNLLVKYAEIIPTKC